jgi:hypothetical protein
MGASAGQFHRTYPTALNSESPTPCAQADDLYLAYVDRFLARLVSRATIQLDQKITNLPAPVLPVLP